MAYSDAQVRVIGYEILVEVGDAIYEILERRLSSRLGPKWFEQSFRTKEKNRKKVLARAAKQDPYLLISQLLTQKNNDFRGAIASEFKAPNNGEYILRQLKKVIQMRNKWMHPEGTFSELDLLKLVEPIYIVFGNTNHPLGDKCERLFHELRQARTGNLIFFSSAFGPDFLDLLRKSEQLAEELYRVQTSLVGQSESEIQDGMLQDGSDEQSAELSKSQPLYWMHRFLTEQIEYELGLSLHELLLLIISFDIDIFVANPEVVIQQEGETLNSSASLTKDQMKDMVRGHVQEVVSWLIRGRELREDLAKLDCDCQCCALYRKYDVPIGLPRYRGDSSVAVFEFFWERFIDWDQLQFLEEVVEEELEKRGVSLEEAETIFALPSGSSDQ